MLHANQQQKNYQMFLAKPASVSYLNNRLANKLLTPEDRVICRPLHEWAQFLLDQFKQLRQDVSSENFYIKVADIYNNAALILFLVGRVELAKELCYSQINLFIRWADKNTSLLKFVAQPWINLSRIDRLLGNIKQSNEKINILSSLQEEEIKLGENKLLAQALQYAINQCEETHEMVHVHRFLEPIKAWLGSHQYSDLLHYVCKKEGLIAKKQQPAMLEAQAIAFCNMGFEQEALAVLTQAKSYVSPIVAHVFSLRECELYVARGQSEKIDLEIHALANLTFDLLNTRYVNVNDILFGLHVGLVLQQMGLSMEAIKLASYCLDASRKLNDELMQARSLNLLHKVGKYKIEIRCIEHQIESLLNKTHYISVQKILNECVMQSFSYKKAVPTIADTLFEILQHFSL